MENLNSSLFLVLNAGPQAGRWTVVLAQLLAEQAIWLIPGLLVVGWLLGGARTKRALLESALTGLVGVLLAQVIGLLAPHPRPFMLGLGTHFLPHVADASFPSDHLTLWWSVAFGLCRFPLSIRWGWCFIALGFPIAWARIYLGVHFPLDMLGALVVALISVWLVSRWPAPWTHSFYTACHRLHRWAFAVPLKRGWICE